MKNPNNIECTPKTYDYVGPAEIFKRIEEKYQGTVIATTEDVLNWLLANNGRLKTDALIICTFIINLEGKLLIADRHSEHVQCANGEAVRSAGEIGFYIDDRQEVKVETLTNQSTGYCPSSTSWVEVENALSKIQGLTIPKGFDPAFVFSYCPDCQTRQIVKDAFYFCAICGHPLLTENDFQKKRKHLRLKKKAKERERRAKNKSKKNKK